MTILRGAGTLLGPVLEAAVIKYFENISSAFNEAALHRVFDFLPEWLADPVVAVVALFVGDGWHLTLGVVFMLIVIFMPGGVIEGLARLARLFRGRSEADRDRTPRSEERRVGKGCVRTCRSRGVQYHSNTTLLIQHAIAHQRKS